MIEKIYYGFYMYCKRRMTNVKTDTPENYACHMVAVQISMWIFVVVALSLLLYPDIGHTRMDYIYHIRHSKYRYIYLVGLFSIYLPTYLYVYNAYVAKMGFVDLCVAHEKDSKYTRLSNIYAFIFFVAPYALFISVGVAWAFYYNIKK